jgi:hypothetical protein
MIFFAFSFDAANEMGMVIVSSKIKIFLLNTECIFYPLDSITV